MTTPTTPASAHQVRLFGGLRVEFAQTPQPLSGSKLQTLFAYLLLHPATTHTRESLTDRFWPHADPARARRYLSDALYRLQQTVGYDWLETAVHTVRLTRPSPLWVDVWAFNDFARSRRPVDHEAAVDLYTDDLLPDLYDDWILPVRVRLREQVLHLLTGLAADALATGRHDTAFTCYHRLTAIDPVDEAAHRGLMHLYNRQGHPAAALAQFSHLQALLRADLDVDPLPETAALAEEIRAIYEQQADKEEITPTSDLPFIGRRRERAVLLQAVSAARKGHGGVFLVEGEAGIGKSRLLQAVADGATWRGLTVGWGQGQELGALTPYMPLDDALRQLFSGRQAGRLQGSLPLETAAALTTMLPQLFPHAPAAPLDPPPDLSAALHDALRRLSAAAPLLIILDDVQWASHTFWQLLHFAVGLEETAVLLILAYRPAELQANPVAWDALQQLDLAAAPRRLALTGLTLHDAAALAAELNREITPEQLHSLQQTTRGNPLYLLESLTAASETTTAPPSLHHLLQTRLDHLSPGARNALEMAAVLGRDVDHGIWQAALGQNLAHTLPELFHARFLYETDRGYTFQHDLTREQVYQDIPPARLKTLHAHAAAILQQQKAGHATLAWHYEQAGRYDLAIRYHRLAGEAALASYAHASALTHFDAALALQTGDAATAREEIWRVMFARQQVLELLGPMATWRASVAEIQTLAAAHDNPALNLAALEARLQIDALDSDLTALQANADAALALAQQLGDLPAEVRVRNVLAWHLMDALVRPQTARTHLLRAAELAANLRDPRLQLTTLGNLSLAQRLTGRSRQSLQTANQMLGLTHLHPSLQRARALALQALASAAMHEAEWQTAWQTMNTAVSLLEELHDLWALGDALFDRVLLGLRIGQLTVARQDIERIMREQQAIGIPAGSHYMLWSGAYAALVAIASADWDAAAGYLTPLQTPLSDMGDLRVGLQVYTALGLWHLGQGNPAAAVSPFSAAVSLWQRGEPSIELTPLLYHAIAAYHCGEIETARSSLAQASAVLEASEARHFQILWHYARSLVEADPGELAAARRAVQEQAARIEDPALRDSFLTGVSLHREVLAGASPAATLTVRLPAADSGSEPITVQWTLDDGAGDAAVLEREGESALRRRRLRRLLDEAAAQRAAPTNSSLAAALNVSRRTIQRDLKTIAISR